MVLERCAECGERPIFGMDGHVCKPKWHCWGDDIGYGRDHCIDVHASDAQVAAELAAEQSDAYGEYEIVSGSMARIFVQEATGGVVQQFTVEGRSVPEYMARRLSDDETAMIATMESRGWKYRAHWAHWGDFSKAGEKERLRLRALVKGEIEVPK